MIPADASGLLIGAVILGAIHGIEPGHGWPVAASYALDRPNKWGYGLAASLILGVGHLISSIAMVLVFFSAKAYFNLTQVNDPILIADGIRIGGPVSLVAGVLLIGLGIREYRHGHGHEHGHGHGHGHTHDGPGHHTHGTTQGGRPITGGDHDHQPNDHPDSASDGLPRHLQVTDPMLEHDRPTVGHGPADASGEPAGLVDRVTAALPFGGGHGHSDDGFDDSVDRGLLGIAWFAFVLGFAHEEEFEIIALCAGSSYCLELMSAYALTVIAGIVGLTLLLIAGYNRFEDRVEQWTPYLPMVSATVLVVMGVGFVIGLF